MSIPGYPEGPPEPPDPMEQREARVERWIDENVVGENFICGCGQQCKLENGVILTPDPYGIPVCPDCAMANPAYAKWVRS